LTVTEPYIRETLHLTLQRYAKETDCIRNIKTPTAVFLIRNVAN